MTDRWVGYFEEKGVSPGAWLAAATDHWSFNERFYGHLVRWLPAGGRVLDVGCGPGFSDLWLAARGYRATGVDNESRIVAMARDLAQRCGVAATFELADAFDLSRHHGQFDLVYSAGVLEHFDRDVTIALLREQARCAPRVLIAIPTSLTRYTAPITDERQYSVRALRRLVADAGLRPVASFGYGDVTATPLHRAAFRLLPRALWRLLQDQGYAYSIAVLGERAAGQR